MSGHRQGTFVLSYSRNFYVSGTTAPPEYVWAPESLSSGCTAPPGITPIRLLLGFMIQYRKSGVSLAIKEMRLFSYTRNLVSYHRGIYGWNLVSSNYLIVWFIIYTGSLPHT